MMLLNNSMDIRLTDCLDKAKGLESIPSKSVDMIFADLPYGKTTAKWDSIIPMKPLFKQYKRIIKDHGAILLFGEGLFTSKLNVVGNDYVPYRYNWTWVKNRTTNQSNCHRMPLYNSENISVFYKHLPTYNPQMRVGKWHNIHYSRKALKKDDFSSGHFSKSLMNKMGTTRWTNKYYPVTQLHFSDVNRGKGKFHPTQKPIKLLEYLIKTYTNQGDVVLDNAMGSGSTGVACALTNRKFIGMEILPKYYKVTQMRINKVFAKKPVTVAKDVKNNIAKAPIHHTPVNKVQNIKNQLHHVSAFNARKHHDNQNHNGYLRYKTEDILYLLHNTDMNERQLSKYLGINYSTLRVTISRHHLSRTYMNA